MKPIIKDLGVCVLVGLILMWSFLAAIERLVFFNTNQYSDLLVNKTVSLESNEKVHELVKNICPQGGADIIQKHNTFYIRCGLLWPRSQVTKVILVNESKSGLWNKIKN